MLDEKEVGVFQRKKLSPVKSVAARVGMAGRTQKSFAKPARAQEKFRRFQNAHVRSVLAVGIS